MKITADSNIAIENQNINKKFNVKEIVNLLMDLSKFKITFFVALSTATGFFLYSESFSYQLLNSTLGLFLIGFGSAALNHLQEVKTDLLMERTSKRPIPSGRISKFNVVLIIFATVIGGSLLIYFNGNIDAVLLGLLTLVWYNVIYTPLKKISAYAVVPGALIGALPPLVGWTAAGGDFLNFEILTFGLFLFIWQLPHFWLLMMIFGEEYVSAGLPSITQKFSREALSKINYLMNIVLGISSYLLIQFNVIETTIGYVVLGLSFLFLLITTKVLLKTKIDNRTVKKSFMFLNAYVLLVVLTIILERVITVV